MDDPNATLEDNFIFDGSVVTFEEKRIKKQLRFEIRVFLHNTMNFNVIDTFSISLES